MTLDRFLRLWGPVILWAGLIFFLSSISGLNSGLGGWDLLLRKCAHATEYAILGLLLLRAVGRELPALILGVCYATTDEIHQHFVANRHASPIDVAIDAAGVVIGVLLLPRAARALLQSRRA